MAPDFVLWKTPARGKAELVGIPAPLWPTQQLPVGHHVRVHVCVSETLPTFRNSDCQTPRLYLRDAKTLRMFRMMGRLEPRILGPGHWAKRQRGELNGVCLCEGQGLGTELSPCLLFMAKVHHLRGLYIFTMILFFHIKED